VYYLGLPTNDHRGVTVVVPSVLSTWTP
jgi:hypothetical protein